MDKDELLKKLIKPVNYENPYWDVKDGLIYNKKTAKILNKDELPFLDDVINYFQMVFDAFETESQVTVIEDRYVEQLNGKIPMIKSHSYAILVFPQINTKANSLTGMKIPNRVLLSQHIPIYAHLHSHGLFNPYRSKVDYNGLNSRTLEIVVGNFKNTPDYRIWLDSEDTAIKNPVYKIRNNKLELD